VRLVAITRYFYWIQANKNTHFGYFLTVRNCTCLSLCLSRSIQSRSISQPTFSRREDCVERSPAEFFTVTSYSNLNDPAPLPEALTGKLSAQWVLAKNQCSPSLVFLVSPKEGAP
jgi:hypothetical protein